MSESKDPPRLPDVVDEAAASPRWLPWLGLALLGAVAAALIAQKAIKGTAPASPDSEVVAGAGAEAPEEPAK